MRNISNNVAELCLFRWLRGGRTIEDMSNYILSPRGETLMILKARRADAGSYSCVAKNVVAETEASFMVSLRRCLNSEVI